MYDLHPALAVGAAYGLAALSWLALRRPSRKRLAGLAVLAVGVGATPWLISSSQPIARFLVSIYSGALILKLWDLHVGVQRSDYPDPIPFLGFLANLATLVHRRAGYELQPTVSANILRLAWSTAVLWFGVRVLMFLVDVEWGGTPFLVEHLAKGGTFFTATCAAFTAMAAAVRLIGGYAPEPVRRPWVARTPADFWRRYNRWIGEALREDVFQPLGGLRAPRRATLGVFVVSGLLHEYVFAAAAGGIQGFQLAFFMVHGVAASLTLGSKPPVLLGVVGTLTFNAATSVLFFASVNQVAPFYQHDLPGWLGGG